MHSADAWCDVLEPVMDRDEDQEGAGCIAAPHCACAARRSYDVSAIASLWRIALTTSNILIVIRCLTGTRGAPRPQVGLKRALELHTPMVFPAVHSAMPTRRRLACGMRRAIMIIRRPVRITPPSNL